MTNVIPAVLRLCGGTVVVSVSDVVGARSWANEDGLYLDLYLTERTIELSYGNRQSDLQADLNNIEQAIGAQF